MTDIYMMVGIPASGKSTLAKELTEASKGIIAYVSRDEVRRKLTGSGKVIMEKEQEVLQQFCLEILTKMSEGYNIIFADATHANPRSRYSCYKNMYSIAKTLDIPADSFKIIPLTIETPYEICYERNSKRNPETAAPDEDMKTFYKNCLYPSKTEIGFDKVFPNRLFYDPATKKFTGINFEEKVGQKPLF